MPIDSKDRKYILLGLRIVADFGATIAVPVILFVIVGRKLDAKYDTNPWLTILGFVIAFAISALMIKRRAQVYDKEYKELNKKDKKNDPSDSSRRNV